MTVQAQTHTSSAELKKLPDGYLLMTVPLGWTASRGAWGYG
jgi:hypothetical protein